MSLTSKNINELVNLCRNGSTTAQIEMYNRYYKAMFNSCLRIVKDKFEAEDIMQESFLSAFTNLDKLIANERFGPWLKRIVINNSISFYQKSHKVNVIGLDDVLYKIENDNAHDQPINSLEIDKQTILEVISSLKSNYAMSLTLNLIEGYDYEEIAEIMNITSGNSRTMISRAKSQLRNRLSSLTIR